MKIAIFDPSGSHGNFAYSQSLVFADDQTQWYIHENIFRRLNDLKIVDASDSNIKICFEGSSKILYYIRSIININNQSWDFVFFNTLQSDWLLNFIFFLFIKKSKTIVLTIHNINSFFMSSKKKSIRLFIKKWSIQLALKKITYFNVFSLNLKQHLLQKLSGAKVFILPYQVHVSSKPFVSAQQTVLKVVVPGTIDLRRRDYYMVVETIRLLSHVSNIMILLLGKPSGNDSKELVKELDKYKHIVKYHTGFISENDFEQQMVASDIIWGPLQREFEVDGVIEEYGVSKETGTTFAMIRYGLPALFPKNIPVMDDLSSGVVYYDNAGDLAEKLIALSNDFNKLNVLKMEAYENAKKFGPSAIRHQFIEIETD
jgi:hypothetical protein